MTDDTEVRDLMHRYATDNEPPLRLTIDTIRGAAARDDIVMFSAPVRRHRRWMAPIAAAAACAVLVGGVAALMGAKNAATTTKPAGSGTGPATPQPTITPTAIPTPTETVDAGARATPAQMPDLLRKLAGPALLDAKESMVLPRTWTVKKGNSMRASNAMEASGPEKATSWVGKWYKNGNKGIIVITTEIRALDLSDAEWAEVDARACQELLREGTCDRTVSGGWTTIESYGRSLGDPEPRVTHTVQLRGHGRSVTVFESIMTTTAPNDVSKTPGWRLTSAQMRAIVTDPRLLFRAPEPLPAYPSYDFCGFSPEKSKTDACRPKG